MSTISLLAVSFELDGVDLVYFLFRALLLIGLVLTEISGGAGESNASSKRQLHLSKDVIAAAAAIYHDMYGCSEAFIKAAIA